MYYFIFAAACRFDAVALIIVTFASAFITAMMLLLIR